jgi:high-affinity K+ transport system ATPase subunit B
MASGEMIARSADPLVDEPALAKADVTLAFHELASASLLGHDEVVYDGQNLTGDRSSSVLSH